MYEVEFFESLVRLADVLAMNPYNYINENDNENWNYANNIKLDLHIKLESLLCFIYD